MNNENPTNNPFGDVNNLGNSFNELLKANDFITPDLTQLTPATKGSIGNYYAGNLSQPPSLPAPYNLQDYGPMFMESLSQSAYDDREYAAPMKFNATRHGENFNRYYTHPEFKNLGFLPYRDNETLYNENSTSYQDWQRGNDHFFNLVWSGIKSGFRSWGDMLSFDPMTPDFATAEEQAEAMAVGYSSRGGVGAFANNLVLNSAHTIGVLAEMALEEGALMGLTALTGGTASGVTVPTMFARALNGFKTISKGLPTVNKFGKASKNLTKAMGDLNDVNKARQYWKTIGNFLNPLERTTDYIQGAKNSQNLLEFTKNHSLFGSFYRDVREINFALAESKLEGGLVANEMSEELYNKFYLENGRTPTSAEATEISNLANKAGFATVGWNLPIILASNKIVFDNMFKGFRPFTRAGGSKLDDALSGRLIFDRRAAKKKLDPFKFEEKNFKNALKGLYRPSSYGRFGLSYLKANFAEGAQEIFQETVSGTAKDYYTALYEDDIARGGAWYNIGKNLRKQVSPEGFEVFMSGFLMGGLIQPIVSIPKYTAQATEYFGDREGYKARRTKQKEQRDEMARMLNDMYKDPLKYFSPEMHNLAASKKIGEEMDKAQDEGDRKQFQDLKDQSVYEHIVTAIQTGKIEFFKNYMSSLKNMSESELKEGFGYNVPNAKSKDFQSKIDKVIDRASKIEARYEYLNSRFKNPFNPKKYDMLSEPEKYLEETLNYTGYNRALRMGTFMMHSFDRTLERMNGIYQDLNSDAGFLRPGQVGKAYANDINILLGNIQNEGGNPDTSILDEIQLLKDEIDTLSEGTAEQKKQATNKKKKLKVLTKLSEEMANLRMRLKESSKVNEEGQLQLDFEGKKLENARERAYKAYKDYLQVIASINGTFVDNEQIENSFAQIMDYTELNNEATNLTDSINILLDPESFNEMARRQSDIAKVQYENKLASIEKALEEYKTKMDQNKLLNDLFKAGYFFDPEYIDDLIKNNVLPPEFYRVADKQIVTKTSHPDDWAKIMEVFQNWSELTEKPIPEAEYETQFDARSRNKYKRDKRTYADYAKQFGFDPNAKSTELSQKDVLEAIISDPNRLATPRERKLAEALLARTKDTDKIFFVKDLSTPGIYENRRVKVDARYSSMDYSSGNTPLEHVILHEIIHRLTVRGLNEDETYKLEITKLYQAAVDHFENTRSGREKPLYGLKNIYEFVAEAMSNDTFQKYLKGIKYEGTEKSAWEEFLDVVSRFLAKVLNITGTDNILDQTIALTTKKIDLKTDDVIDEGPSIGFSNLDEFNKLPAELQKQLKSEYNKYKKKIEENTDETPNNLAEWFRDSQTARDVINKYNETLDDKDDGIEDAEIITDDIDQIPEPDNITDYRLNTDYNQFSKSEINKLESLIESNKIAYFAFNSVQHRKLNPSNEPNLIISINGKEYKILSFDRLSSNFADKKNIPIKDLLANDVNEEIETWLDNTDTELYVYSFMINDVKTEDFASDYGFKFVTLKNAYKRIKSLDDLNKWRDDAIKLMEGMSLEQRKGLLWNKNNKSFYFDSALIDLLYKKKTNEISKDKLDTTFDNAKVGQEVILKDPDKVRSKPLIIIKKTKGQIQLRDENGDIIKINKSKFAEKVKTVRDKPTKSEDKIDPKDEKLAEETLENLKNSEKDDTKSIDDVENKSQDEINDDVSNAFKNDC
tara:strand:- start:1449 stop:6482 length:5034 start_codon:yes stop_codon:yes gene_type:complete